MLFIFPWHTVKMLLVFWHPSCQFAVPCLILDSGGVDCQRIKILILSYGFRGLGAQDYYYFFMVFCILILSLTEPGYNELQLNGKNNLISTFEFQKNNIMRMSVMTEC